MATLTERDTLLSVPCPWCRAGVRSECTGANGRPITTLDGASHDARWRSAFGTSAPILSEAVARVHGERDDEQRPLHLEPFTREPVLVGAVDRPW